MDELDAKIRQLAQKRNEFFLHNPTATRSAFLREIKHDRGKLVQSALTAYLTGRILNLNPEFDQNAIDSLNKSLRLDVNNANAWIELGKAAWKKPDLEQALTAFKVNSNLLSNTKCFQQAVDIKSEPRSLCYYAAAIRNRASLSTDKKQKLLLIKQCLEMCKLSLSQDPSYPFAWPIHIFSGFLLLHNLMVEIWWVDANECFDYKRFQDHSIDAYEKALNQKILFINADLHINYQEALLYKQNYRLALFHAERAVQIEPHFDSAIERLDSLRTFLLRLSEGISRKGMLPSRKIKDIVASINNADSSNELKTINELKIGVNPEVAICTKILSVISHNQKVPFTIIGIDQNSNCFGVTVFNFSNTFNLLANDQLLIPTPHVVSVEDVEINETKLNFKLIRVDDPSTLIRNKKRLSSTSRSLTDVSFQFKNK
ncbi:Tetratricopeptide repeat protein 5 [Aphelenchoides besseyi]|nr:Tetratricopeptide repeat protein 5 [Aphelenchoides besseyi]